MEKENNPGSPKMINKGDAYVIQAGNFCRFALSAYSLDGKFGLCYDWRSLTEVEDLDDMFFIVTYIGNGIWQEYSSNVKIRINVNNPNNNYSYFDIDERGYTTGEKRVSIDFSNYSVDTVPYKNIAKYKACLDAYRSFASETPLIYDGKISKMDLDIREKYKSYTDEERKKVMLFAITTANGYKDQVLSSIENRLRSLPDSLTEEGPHL